MSVAASRERLGLLGGTFDPPTYAHIELAELAIKHFHLDRVALVVAADPWQKAPVALAAQRVAMCTLAALGHRDIEVWDLELRRGRTPTYTIDTLRQLTAKMPDVDFSFIIGGDVDTATWRDEAECRRLVEFVTVDRPGYGSRPGSIDFGCRECSSTQVRRALSEGSHTGLLNPLVELYIARNGLYRNSCAA